MRFSGKLHTWNEERGFGFIRPEGGGDDIFVHVSSLPKPRPGPDEVLTFAIALNADGKKKALDVRLQQVEAAGFAEDRQRTRPARNYAPWPTESGEGGWGGRIVGALLTLVMVAAIGGYGWSEFKKMRPAVSAEPTERSAPAAAFETSFRCDGRTHCSQMTSCAEATYFLKNCPGTQMDGNNDGVPCEKQWCGR